MTASLRLMPANGRTHCGRRSIDEFAEHRGANNLTLHIGAAAGADGANKLLVPHPINRCLANAAYVLHLLSPCSPEPILCKQIVGGGVTTHPEKPRSGLQMEFWIGEWWAV